MTNYEQMNEENEKMKQDWQDEGGKVNERIETWSVNNKSIIDGSEFTTNISESFNSANKVSTVAWPSMWGSHQYDPERRVHSHPGPRWLQSGVEAIRTVILGGQNAARRGLRS